MMLRTTLIALDQADKTNNYSILLALGAPELQRHSLDEMSKAFAGLRVGEINLAAVAVMTPQLSQPPIINTQGQMELVGTFPTQPLQIRFRITYAAVSGHWMVSGLNVTAAPSS